MVTQIRNTKAFVYFRSDEGGEQEVREKGSVGGREEFQSIKQTHMHTHTYTDATSLSLQWACSFKNVSDLTKMGGHSSSIRASQW